jgi:hypothetical protein
MTGGPRKGECAHCGRTIEAYVSYWGDHITGKMFCSEWRGIDDPHGGAECVEAAHKLTQARDPIPSPDGKRWLPRGLFYYTDG